jgi:hypothetical protein
MSMCGSSNEMKTERSSIRGEVRTERTEVSCIHLAALFLSGTQLHFGTWPIAVVVRGRVLSGTQLHFGTWPIAVVVRGRVVVGV